MVFIEIVLLKKVNKVELTNKQDTESTETKSVSVIESVYRQNLKKKNICYFIEMSKYAELAGIK
jgi:hypothetical protein